MERLGKLKEAPVNPYFDVLAAGKFGPEQVSVTKDAPLERPQELIDLGEEAWNKVNAKRETKGFVPLVANPQLSFKSALVEANTLAIRVSPSNYKDHIVMQDKDIREQFSQFIPETLGTNVLVRTRDGKLMVIQRGLDVATKPGAMSVPGGQPHLQTDLDEKGNWAPFKTASRELTEETGVSDAELHSLTLDGIIYNKAAHNPSVVFIADTALTADEIRERRSRTDKEVEVKFISEDQGDIENAILWWASSPSPSGAATLALYGREKFGEEWFRWIGERIVTRHERLYSKLSPEQLKQIDKKAARRLTELS